MQDSQLPLLDFNAVNESFSEEEVQNLTKLLGNQLVRRYLRSVLATSVQEFLVNEAETIEQEQKLLARYKKLKGIQYMCTFLLNHFQETKP